MAENRSGIADPKSGLFNNQVERSFTQTSITMLTHVTDRAVTELCLLNRTSIHSVRYL